MYANDPKPKFKVFEERNEENSFQTSLVEFITHTGTHVDAPSHLFSQGVTIDKVSFLR